MGKYICSLSWDSCTNLITQYSLMRKPLLMQQAWPGNSINLSKASKTEDTTSFSHKVKIL